MQLVTSVDWFQYIVHVTDIEMRGTKDFTIQVMEYGTRIYKEVYEVSYKGELFAVVAAFPRLPQLNPVQAQVKILNNWLTNRKCKQLINRMNRQLNWDFQNVSRVDLAIDFKRFKGNKSPEKFIHDFTSGNIRKLGRGNWSQYGKVSQNGLRYETLKFGSETSKVSYKLYNKTKEMDAVKMKPYIVDLWRSNGITDGADVWRLEFSLKSDKRNVVDLETGEVINLHEVSFFDKEVRKEILNQLLKQYWQFVPKPKKKRAKISRGKRIDFFDLTNVNTGRYDRLLNEVKKDATRSEKIFLKRLKEVNDDLRGKNQMGLYGANVTSRFIDELMTLRIMKLGLTKWARYKDILPTQIIEQIEEINRKSVEENIDLTGQGKLVTQLVMQFPSAKQPLN